MTTLDTIVTVEIHDNAYWPDQAVLSDFAEQDAQATEEQLEQADRLVEGDTAYTALYFVS